MRSTNKRSLVILTALFVAGLGWSAAAYADEHVRGVITARGNDGTLMVRTDDSSNLIIVLDDATKVIRTDGLREMKMSSAALIPGLRVRVEGLYLTTNRFAAQRVSVSRADLKMALAIKGGVDPTNQRSLENQQRIEQNVRALEQQRQTLQRQEQEIAANKEHIRANKNEIVMTNTTLDKTNMALDATNTRIANLDDYQIVSTMTVPFGNGVAAIAKKHKAELQQLAAQAQSTPAYLIQVQGYASAVGPDALNQRLSMQRAQAVTAVLSQNGIPPTHMLVPATMGMSGQVASNKTVKGQAENRRAVVTLLQNKGITDSNPANRGGSTVERLEPPQR